MERTDGRWTDGMANRESSLALYGARRNRVGMPTKDGRRYVKTGAVT